MVSLGRLEGGSWGLVGSSLVEGSLVSEGGWALLNSLEEASRGRLVIVIWLNHLKVGIGCSDVTFI